MFTVGAPFSSTSISFQRSSSFSSLVMDSFIKCFKESVAAVLLGVTLSVEYTSSFHLFTHLCTACLTVLGGFVWSWADTHTSLGRRPRGTPADSCSCSGGFSQQGRRSYRRYSVCVCVCVCGLSNLTAKRPYGHSYIYFFFSGIDGLLLSLANSWGKFSQLHCLSMLLSSQYLSVITYKTFWCSCNNQHIFRCTPLLKAEQSSKWMELLNDWKI